MCAKAGFHWKARLVEGGHDACEEGSGRLAVELGHEHEGAVGRLELALDVGGEALFVRHLELVGSEREVVRGALEVDPGECAAVAGPARTDGEVACLAGRAHRAAVSRRAASSSRVNSRHSPGARPERSSGP